MAAVVRNLNTEEEKLFNKHRGTISNKVRRNKLRLEYRDMHQRVSLVGFSIPEHMHDVRASLSWPFQACESVSNRIEPEEFTLTTKSGLLGELEESMVDSSTVQAERLAIASMVELSSAFIFTTPGDTSRGEPKVITTARTALTATAERDPRTRRITSALEVVSTKEYLLYLPGKTLKIEQLNYGKWTVTYEYQGVGDLVMCTPYTWRESLERPLGHSRISRAVMDITDRFFRSSIREEVQADLFSVPRMAMKNADESAFVDTDGNRISPLKALMGAVWGIPPWRDEETGDLVAPTLEQFAQASMEPHQAMRRGLAMEFSGETKIPIGQLGIVQDNPSSADAIRASEYALVGLITKQLAGIANAREDMARKHLATLQGKWTPAMQKDLSKLRATFADPGTPTKSAQADAGMKTLTALPDIVGTGVDLDLFSLSEGQKEIINAYRARNSAGGLIDKILSDQTNRGDSRELDAAKVLKAKAEAFTELKNAGVDPKSAALAAGLTGLTFDESPPAPVVVQGEP